MNLLRTFDVTIRIEVYGMTDADASDVATYVDALVKQGLQEEGEIYDRILSVDASEVGP